MKEKWKLVVNVNKTKVMVFRKRDRLRSELNFYYNNNEVEIVSQFTYFGIVFTTWVCVCGGLVGGGGGLSNKRLILYMDSH